MLMSAQKELILAMLIPHVWIVMAAMIAIASWDFWVMDSTAQVQSSSHTIVAYVNITNRY